MEERWEAVRSLGMSSSRLYQLMFGVGGGGVAGTWEMFSRVIFHVLAATLLWEGSGGGGFYARYFSYLTS